MQAALLSFGRKVGYQLNPVQKCIVLTLKEKCLSFTEPSGPTSLHERYIPHHTYLTFKIDTVRSTEHWHTHRHLHAVNIQTQDAHEL